MREQSEHSVLRHRHRRYRVPGPRLACRRQPRVLRVSRWDRAADALFSVACIAAGVWLVAQLVFGGLPS